MGSKAALFGTNQDFLFRVSPIPENTCIYLQYGESVENAALRRRLFSGSTKTKICQNLELLLGDLFEVCRNCAKRNETLTKKILMPGRTSQGQNKR